MRSARGMAIAVLVAAALGFVGGAGTVRAAPSAAGGGDHHLADHLGGTFDVCGRVVDYVAPVPGTPGSVTVGGVVGFAAHTFPIADTVAADPTLAALGAADTWSCLAMVGDGVGVLTSVGTTTATTVCGTVSVAGAVHRLSHEFTTTVLDGQAATAVAADADLQRLLDEIAAVTFWIVPACLDITLDGAGNLTGLALDYELGGLSAPLTCGPVDGTPIAYRDPASQPYPDGATVGVGGFTLDASLFDGVHLAVLAYHLDAGIELCLLVRVVNTAIVDAAVITDGQPAVCGALEVRGGLVNVDAVVVSQSLTAVNFAEPADAELAAACMTAGAQENAAVGGLTVCGRLDAIGATSYTVSGVTFQLEAPLASDGSLVIGATQAVQLDGPFPYDPVGAANPARLRAGALDGCASPTLPDVAVPRPGPNPTVIAIGGALLVGAGAAWHARRRRAVTTVAR